MDGPAQVSRRARTGPEPHPARGPAPAEPDRAAEALLAELDTAQRLAVTTMAQPLAVLAGAGSGKTRVLTRRIAWQAATGAIDPAHTLAVTFTRKAAGQLRSRLRALGLAVLPTAGTVHAIALAQLRRRQSDRGRRMPILLERKVPVLARLARRGRLDDVAELRELAGEIEWAKARLVTPDAYPDAAVAAARTPPWPIGDVAALYERYEREKRARGLVDFDDLVGWCAEALEHDGEFAAAQRWRFCHFFVDEFQDTTPLQLRLLRGWLGGRDDLFVVGDPNQAIYGFAGAEPSFLTRFSDHFRGGRVVHLDINHRCTPEVVGAADALLADGDPRHRPHRSFRPPGPRLVVAPYEDDRAEAEGVSHLLRSSHAAGVPWSRHAVLYRSHAQSTAFEEAFTRAGIPFRVRDGRRFLERPAVRSALQRLAADSSRIGNAPFTSLLRALDGEGTTHADTEEGRTHVAALVRLGLEYAETDGPQASLEGFRAFLATVLRGDDPDDAADAVALLTFHGAKGLEFDTVFVTGLERGLVPITHATTPEQRAEERRLLYVALTRAERVLYLTHAARRALGTRVVARQRSPWLAPIESSVAPAGTDHRSHRHRRGLEAHEQLTAAREHVRASPRPDGRTPDAALLEALVEWRRRQARAAGVPAYVIFHDETLRAVAARKPRSRAALLSVHGIGPVKAERHGAALLELVARHTI